MNSVSIIDKIANVFSFGNTQQDPISQNNTQSSTSINSDVLKQDIVTIGQDCSCDTNSQNEFSSNHSKARNAYLGLNKNNCSVHDNKQNATDDENQVGNTDKSSKTESSPTEEKKTNGEPLTDEEKQEVKELKQRDQEVQEHEKAHQRAGGSYASSPSYEYESGPDGKKYAVSGHVNIDASEEDTPEKTAAKMRIIIKAANAPAEPSSQDRKVSAEASKRLSEANSEMAKEKQEKMKESSSADEDNNKEADKNASLDDISNSKNSSISQGKL